jgi:hypothetical protein
MSEGMRRHEDLGSYLVWQPALPGDMQDPLAQLGTAIGECVRCLAQLTVVGPVRSDEDALAAMTRQGWDTKVEQRFVRRSVEGEKEPQAVEHLYCHGCLTEAG